MDTLLFVTYRQRIDYALNCRFNDRYFVTMDTKISGGLSDVDVVKLHLVNLVIIGEGNNVVEYQKYHIPTC